jgi:hypothetical protein
LREIAAGYITESILEERDQPIEDLLQMETTLREDLRATTGSITLGD